MRRAADDDRYDRGANAKTDVEAACSGPGREIAAVLPQLLQPPRFPLHDAERRRCGGGHGRRRTDAVDGAWRGEFQKFDQGAGTGDVAAGRDQRLAERPHPDVDVRRVDVLFFRDAAAGGAEYAQGVGFIDHQPGAVAALELDELGEFGNVTVHAIEALDDDQGPAIAGTVETQRPFDRLQITMWTENALGAGELGALGYAVVDRHIGDDEVFRPQEPADD